MATDIAHILLEQNEVFSLDQIMKELEIGSEHCIVGWKQFCRDVRVDYFFNDERMMRAFSPEGNITVGTSYVSSGNLEDTTLRRRKCF